MSQHEYSVPLSPAKPEDIVKIAKKYLKEKEKQEKERRVKDAHRRTA